MAWKKPDVLWDANPHTIAKIELLKSYLKQWFAILGRSRYGQNIVYVDGFCGPGEYRNYPDGSPIAAIEAANGALNNPDVTWNAGKVYLIFIDRDQASVEYLNARLATLQTHSRIKIQTLAKPFIEGLASVKQSLSLSFDSYHPLFVFIDPFGATGAPFEIVAEILKSDCSEVLINLDADGIARIFKAGDQASHEKNLSEIFGDESWRELSSKPNFHEQCAHVLELYKRRLKSLPNVQYVFSFEMRNKGGLDYFLVFASQHPLGLVKMKEAMKKIDQTGTYQFSDASQGQALLFRFDNPDDFAPRMFQHFKGRCVPWQTVVDYALNETPFVNPKKMLAALEKQALIHVEAEPGIRSRRKNTYPDGAIRAIVFGEASDV